MKSFFFLKRIHFFLGGPGGLATLSGLQEPDYPSMEGSGLNQRSLMRKVPLPAELVEHFGHMQCNCLIGLFPEVERAWLTIDSDIYVWRFADGRDLAYYDGLADTILSVGLVQPKKGIFRQHIQHLLCLTTPVEIVLLGVTFSVTENDEEMQLLPEPLFSLSTDSTVRQKLSLLYIICRFLILSFKRFFFVCRNTYGQSRVVRH